MLTRLIGVYDADGDLRGELAYLWGKARGVRHCGLCDVTHGPLRQKPAWRRFVADLGLPFDLLHLDERPADVTAAMATVPAPVVFGREDSGTLRVLLDAAELADCGGSIEEFDRRLRAALAPTRAANSKSERPR